MKIQTAPQGPALNKKPLFQKGEAVSITRTFEAPIYDSKVLGHIPPDRYEHNWFGSPHAWGFGWSETVNTHGGGSLAVHRDVPRLDSNGQPKMQTVTETLTEAPYSQKGATLWSAGTGAVVGAGSSALTGMAQGAAFHPVAAVVSALVGGAIGAALGYKTASGDEVKEEWQTRSIDKPTMTGYTHHVRPDTYTEEVNCRYEKDSNGNQVRRCDQETRIRGFWHSYEPNIRWQQVGSYRRPELVHTNSVSPLGASLISGAVGAAVGIGIRLLGA